MLQKNVEMALSNIITLLDEMITNLNRTSPAYRKLRKTQIFHIYIPNIDWKRTCSPLLLSDDITSI